MGISKVENPSLSIQTAKNESLRIVDHIDFTQAWNQLSIDVLKI